MELATAWFPTTLDWITRKIAESETLAPAEAVGLAVEFLRSDYPALTPYADINARLHAGVALHCRGAGPRQPRESDLFDFDHIATYAPYFDVLITDKFFGSLCAQGHMGIGARWETSIRSLRPADIPEFIDWTSEVSDNSGISALARRVHEATGASLNEFADDVRGP